MTDAEARSITVGADVAARDIAIRTRAGSGRGILFLGGFKSDMRGTKAEALDAFAAASGRAFTRFDYSGHGSSGGAFTDGTISRWLEEAAAVLDTAPGAPLVLVGSSMGGWIALLLALAEARSGRRRISGLVLLAPAVDMTHRLILPAMTEAARAELAATGVFRQPSDYSDDPYLITQTLITDGELHLLGGTALSIGVPVHIIQGARDTDVPFDHALDLFAQLCEDDVVLTLIKDGDHRLSRAQDLDKIIAAVEAIG